MAATCAYRCPCIDHDFQSEANTSANRPECSKTGVGSSSLRRVHCLTKRVPGVFTLVARHTPALPNSQLPVTAFRSRSRRRQAAVPVCFTESLTAAFRVPTKARHRQFFAPSAAEVRCVPFYNAIDAVSIEEGDARVFSIPFKALVAARQILRPLYGGVPGLKVLLVRGRFPAWFLPRCLPDLFHGRRSALHLDPPHSAIACT